VAATARAHANRLRWPRIPVSLRWAGGAALLLLIGLAIFLSVFQWNWLRRPIDDYLSGRLHRQVTIHGNFSGHVWSWTPSASANDVTVAQPAWAGAGQMATIPRLNVAVDLKALLGGQFVLTLVDVQHPTFTLRRDDAGRDNWTFTPPGAATQPLKLPPIRRLAIADGRFSFTDAQRDLVFSGVVTSNEQVAGYGHGRFTMTGQGTLHGAAFAAEVLGGTLIGVDPNRPYPFHADVRAGATRITADGALTKPFDLGALQATARVSGEDLANLYSLTGFALPNSPPYDLAGHITRSGSRFDFTEIHGRIGSTDLTGHLEASTTGGRPDLTGDLASRRLQLADLTAIIGGAPRAALKGAVTSPLQRATAAKLTAEDRVLPDARLDVARLRAMDADVRYHAETVDGAPLGIRQATIHARLDHGLLTLEPLSLMLPRGAVSGSVRLNARGATPVTSVDLALARAQAQELLPRSKTTGLPPLEGPVAASMRLTGYGDSVRAAAASAGGVAVVAMPEGQMRQLLAELMGVDVARSLFLYLSNDQRPTPVRCAVAEFHAQAGVLTARRLVLDTDVVRADGSGVIDLRNETLNLVMKGKPKHFRLLRIAAPIILKGRFTHPKLGLDLSKALPQVGASVALGVLVSPLAIALPFITPGAKGADCDALLAEARGDGAPIPTSPAPARSGPEPADRVAAPARRAG
jgi:AsmA family protein